MSAQCKYIQAAYPTMADDDFMCSGHRHEDRVFALAEAMAERFQQPEPTDEQIAWFLDDADAVVDDFEPTPAEWSVSMLGTAGEPGLDWTFLVNGEPYVIQSSDNGEPTYPVSRTTWLEWVGEEDDE